MWLLFEFYLSTDIDNITLFLSSKDCEKKLTINLKINAQPKNINEL